MKNHGRLYDTYVETISVFRYYCEKMADELKTETHLSHDGRFIKIEKEHVMYF